MEKYFYICQSKAIQPSKKLFKMKRTVVSTSAKTKTISTTGRRVKTEMVIYKSENGKKKNGKTAYTSQTRHETI